ncbi:MAG: hypothetical protein MJ075_07125 [Oscillospiraceae bacterium]|nr:hypothetical protein [Oscillospiraceae bacterium]
MEQYVQEIRIKQWCELIKAANNSGIPRMQWLRENGISKDAFYYWQRKVQRYYAEQNGLVPEAATTKRVSLVEVPLAQASTPQAMSPAAIIRLGSITIELSANAPAEFMESMGRMIHNAL